MKIMLYNNYNNRCKTKDLSIHTNGDGNTSEVDRSLYILTNSITKMVMNLKRRSVHTYYFHSCEKYQAFCNIFKGKFYIFRELFHDPYYLIEARLY